MNQRAMTIIKLKCEFPLYLLAIKDAFEAGVFPADDQETLKALFEHGLLYSALLDQDNLCSNDTLTSIAAFCKLLERELPPPNVDYAGVLSFQLSSAAAMNPSAALSRGLRKEADALQKIVMVDLLSVFHMAVSDVSYRLQNTQVVDQADAENAKYVIGMAEITARNLEMSVAQCGNLADRNYEPVHKFFADGTRFAASLKSSGAGVAP